MIERERINKRENLTPELLGSRPLVETWTKDFLPIFEIRKRLISQLTDGATQQDDDITKFKDGVAIPSFLIPIMRRWGEEGPLILGSYCHPEEFDLYKFAAQLNLLQLLEKIKTQGIEIPKTAVVENWYETVGLNRTVTAPLNFGDSFPLKEDILGLGGIRAGSNPLDIDQQLQVFRTIDSEKIARRICERLEKELVERLSKIPNLTRRERFEKKEAVRDLVMQRINLIVNFAESATQEVSLKEKPTVNDFLIEFEQRFGGFIIGGINEFGSTKKLNQITGIEEMLSSRNEKYANLILETLGKLVDARGTSVLKKLINSTGEGLFLKIGGGKEIILTVDKESEGFVTMDKKTWEIIERVTDSKLIQFVRDNNFISLAKPETLALIAGGMTFHMGSEHDNREKALLALGLNDDKFRLFRNYLFGLRIGQDLEQGNSIFLLNDTRPIPAILAFILFGDNFLRQELIKRSGVRSRPESLNEGELKKLAAEKLIESFLSEEAHLKGPGIMHAGYLWE